MHGYRLPLATCIAAALTTLLTLGASNSWAASITQQRQAYDQALRALKRGDRSSYLHQLNELRSYPLLPVLTYTDLKQRLNTASSAEIERFLHNHSDLPQARWLKRNWLKQLAKRQQWSNFAKHYDGDLDDSELACAHANYLYSTQQLQLAHEQAKQLWLVGNSQPKACDTVFKRWEQAGQLSEQLRWQRIELAAAAGNSGLVRYLSRGLTHLRPYGQLMLKTLSNPSLLRESSRFRPVTPYTQAIVKSGLQRLARKNTDLALALLERYTQDFNFNAENQLELVRPLALRLAYRHDARALPLIAQYDPQLSDPDLSAWRIRLLLRLERWSEAAEVLQQLPPAQRQESAWRYWLARSLEQQAQSDHKARSQLLYQELSQERDFYGFLAADRIQTPYQLNHQPMALSQTTIDRVRNLPGIQRAMEFIARGENVNARREWYHVSKALNREELVAQARLAYEIDWYFPAIRTISQARYWDDLDIRFPMPYRDTLTQAARRRDIHPSWVFAITRQESAFMADARSHAGASGLMQLMPATAKETARRYGIPLRSTLDPKTNIQLGSAYLSQVYRQFNGNRILASAAYNAGPGRVRQWLNGARHLPSDVWVENIPFNETRKYVQNVLTYAVIYGQKLDMPHAMLEKHEQHLH